MYFEELYGEYQLDLENHPKVSYNTPEIHSIANLKYTFVDDITGYQCKITRVDDGTYRAYLTISDDHPYLNCDNFSEKARNTIKIHDGLGYGHREYWGISFNVQDDYSPQTDELGIYHKRPPKNELRYWNFENVYTEIKSLALQFYDLKC